MTDNNVKAYQLKTLIFGRAYQGKACMFKDSKPKDRKTTIVQGSVAAMQDLDTNGIENTNFYSIKTARYSVQSTHIR